MYLSSDRLTRRRQKRLLLRWTMQRRRMTQSLPHVYTCTYPTGSCYRVPTAATRGARATPHYSTCPHSTGSPSCASISAPRDAMYVIYPLVRQSRTCDTGSAARFTTAVRTALAPGCMMRCMFVFVLVRRKVRRSDQVLTTVVYIII